MRNKGFTLLEVLVALGMFVLAVGGLSMALDRAFSASNVLRRDVEVRQQVESLVDQAIAMPLDQLEQGKESGSDALGIEYFMGAERTDQFRNRNDEELGGLWKVTVRAKWEEQGEKQEWTETFLRYDP